MTLRIASVGEQAIEGSPVTIRVTQPDGTKKTQTTPIPSADGKTPDGQGELHSATVERFTDRFKIANPATVGACLVEAYMDAAIGGDSIRVKPQVV